MIISIPLSVGLFQDVHTATMKKHGRIEEQAVKRLPEIARYGTIKGGRCVDDIPSLRAGPIRDWLADWVRNDSD